MNIRRFHNTHVDMDNVVEITDPAGPNIKGSYSFTMYMANGGNDHLSYHGTDGQAVHAEMLAAWIEGAPA